MVTLVSFYYERAQQQRLLTTATPSNGIEKAKSVYSINLQLADNRVSVFSEFTMERRASLNVSHFFFLLPFPDTPTNIF